VGFRSPDLADMLADLATQLMQDDSSGHYRDPPLNPMIVGDEIAPQFVAQAKKLLLDALDDDALIGDWLARFMTQPKYPDLQDMTGESRQASFAGRHYRNGQLVD
jgi:50S ribosomal protein L16 3-hydroxylase